MQMSVCLGPQPAQVGLGRFVLLAPRDQRLHLDIEGLDADLELQRARRKSRQPPAQRRRQVIRYQFEVQERWIVRRTFNPLQEEVQDRGRGLDAQIEGPVDELVAPCTALPERFEFLQETIERERPRGPVQRRQAELALEGASARRLDIDVTMPEVFGRSTRRRAARSRPAGAVRRHGLRERTRGPCSSCRASRAKVTSPQPVTTWSASRQIAWRSTSWLTSGPPTTTTVCGAAAFSSSMTRVVCCTFQMYTPKPMTRGCSASRLCRDLRGRRPDDELADHCLLAQLAQVGRAGSAARATRGRSGH